MKERMKKGKEERRERRERGEAGWRVAERNGESVSESDKLPSSEFEPFCW